MTNAAFAHADEFPFYSRHSNEAWWEQLPDSFSTHREQFDLTAWNSVKIHSLSVSDYLFRTVSSLAVVLRNLNAIRPLLSPEKREPWEFYKNPEFLSNPDLFFKAPGDVKMRAHKVSMPLLNLKDAIVEDLTFQSDFEPINPDLYWDDVFGSEHPVTRARYIRHAERNRPTIIAIHGFAVDGYDINTALLGVRRYFKMGMNVLLYTMPFHGPRMAPGSMFSGDGFFSLDVTSINENMAYSTYDLRAYINYLYDHNASSVGLTGLSLGGYQSALAAAIDDRISYVIPIIPLVSVIDLILEWEPIGSLLRALLNFGQVDIKDVRHALAVHSPISHAPRLDKDKLFIVAGMGDRMTSPKHARLLWEHWDRPEIHWFPGNHLIHLEREKFFERIDGFLHDRNII